MIGSRLIAGDGDKSPISHRGHGSGVLCLHGFSGTPFEIRPLAEALGELGYAVEAPLLAGHGGSLEDLARSRWPEWLLSAEAALDRLVERTGGRPAAVIGFSMGGLLALKLARLRPANVLALAILSAPLRLRPFQVRTVRFIMGLPRLFRVGPLGRVPKLAGSDVSDPEMRRRNPCQTALPLSATESVFDLMDLVRPELPQIRVPAFVAHGRDDRTVPIDDSFEVAGSLGSDIVETLWLEHSRHLVALDVERSMLIDAVARFLHRHAFPSAGEAI